MTPTPTSPRAVGGAIVRAMSEYPRCATCRWWTDTTPKRGPHAQTAAEWAEQQLSRDYYDPDAERTPPPFPVRYCTAPTLAIMAPPVGRQGAAIMDGSEYMAFMVTAEHFGCVNHDAPAPEPA